MVNKENTKIASRRIIPVPFNSIEINYGFWAQRMKACKEKTISACLEQCEKTGRISNFEKAAGLLNGKFDGIYFNDSDVYKVLEGVAYTLMNNPDPELEKRADEIIDKIAAAQEEDGYLDTYFTLEAPDKKFTDMEKHEDYCAGHLIEAAVAYKHATGKRKFLDVACRLADKFDSVFGPGKKNWVTGHEEIELALVKLYHETGEERYLRLANWFLEERGHGHGRGMIWDKEDWGPRYCQDDKPVREMSDIAGHAVRAMYLYTGMADVAAVTGDQGYMDALRRLWESVVSRNMYITGGIGSSKFNEGFTEDYDLPNDTAYCETCASVGMVFWNHRMNLMTGESVYVDVLERSMYNGALAGVSLEGDKFFYVNPLYSNGNHHRVEWYDCSCCPTQIARFIPSIGNYVYAVSHKGVYINLYIACRGNVKFGQNELTLTQTTDYPWDGCVKIKVEPQKPGVFEINLRLPGWCKSAELYVNDKPVSNFSIDKGYIKLERNWEKGDVITFCLSMPVEIIHPHPKVKVNKGKIALQRGPLVYCFEEVDNSNLESIAISSQTKFLVEYRKDLLDGVTIIRAFDGDKEYVAVPYYAWDNREPGGMIVWVPEKVI